MTLLEVYSILKLAALNAYVNNSSIYVTSDTQTTVLPH